MNDVAADKRSQIVANAVGAFARYGFKRTSMEDIAEAAGMSRPALYQHFRNKTEIFRAGSEEMQRAGLEAASAAAAGDGPLAERLAAFLIAYKGPAWRVVMTTPHGREMMDLNAAIADDVTMAVVEDAQSRIAALLAPHLGAGWDAGTLARLLSFAAWSTLEKAEDETTFEADMRSLAAIWTAAATAPAP